MDKYKIIVSEKATQMLVSHVAYLSQVNYEAAQKLIIEFENSVNALEFMPHRCPWLRASFFPNNKYRYLIFAKHYILIYQVKDNIVYADYVVDTRQDYKWLL